MDRQLHKKYIPQCPRNYGMVDQYMFKNPDSNKYRCYNGISHPIYDCKGWVNYSLPLHMYPPVNDVHPQIKMVHRQHLNYRGPYKRRFIVEDEHHGTRENFTSDGGCGCGGLY